MGKTVQKSGFALWGISSLKKIRPSTFSALSFFRVSCVCGFAAPRSLSRFTPPPPREGGSSLASRAIGCGCVRRDSGKPAHAAAEGGGTCDCTRGPNRISGLAIGSRVEGADVPTRRNDKLGSNLGSTALRAIGNTLRRQWVCWTGHRLSYSVLAKTWLILASAHALAAPMADHRYSPRPSLKRLSAAIRRRAGQTAECFEP
jgi:hypothetical protein